MMSVKGGTQTWSTAQQTSSLKAPAEKNVSATALAETAKAPGKDDQPIGDFANKLVDPNWVDPAKMRKVGGDTLNKDAFLKLMLAQMKNQDPTSPLKSHEMAAQLAQFTSLEQLYNINDSLGEMKKAQDPSKSFDALQFIGKSVSGDSSKVIRAKGDKEHEFNFNLPASASEVTVKVRSATGDIVRTYDLKNLKEGANKVTWNGIGENGNETGPGEYQFIIEAKSSNGTKLAPKTEFEGRITGVNFTATGPVLLIGNQTIRVSDVRKIVDPGLNPRTEKDQNKPATLSKEEQLVETRKKIQSKNTNPTVEVASNLESVNMAGALAEKARSEVEGKDGSQ